MAHDQFFQQNNPRKDRRVEALIFLIAFVAFAWFNQGGGWNQNARFAEVRAIVEQGKFSIDSFLIYERGDDARLKRVSIENGEIRRDGKTLRLAWVGENGNLVPVNGLAAEDKSESNVEAAALTDFAASGDVAFARGHFHPNKPPGSSFVAAPGYFLIRAIERIFHFDADDWRVIVANEWLTSALSVGLISAAGCVIFFRLAKLLAPGQNETAAFWSAIALAFGTTFFPFATLLFDHDLTAVFLLAGFYFAFFAKNNAQNNSQKNTHRLRSLYLSGLAAGMAAITNYVAAVAVAMIGVYILATQSRRRPLLRTLFSSAAMFSLGVLGPLLAICIYNQFCFGSPFALSNNFQNPLFKNEGPTFLGMFGVPQPDVAIALIISPFRGLLCYSPVLVMSLFGLRKMRGSHRAEFWLIVAIFALLFLVNVTFFGWHAGFSSGPRYLIPVLPFLMLPVVFAWRRFPKITASLAIVSVAINFIFTAVDAESPVGVGGLATTDGRPMWSYSPLMEYALPLFAQGRAWPLLDELLTQATSAADRQLAAENKSSDEHRTELQTLGETWRSAIVRGDTDPFLLASIYGPVSVNPITACEGGYYQIFEPHSEQTRWSSFNIGEFIFPESRVSLVPLLVIVGLLIGAALWLLKTSAQYLNGSENRFPAKSENQLRR